MRIVLAYSGGLATSAAISWLREQHRADVIAVTLDVGQGRALEAVRDRALAAGAVRAHVVDVREEFARDFALPSLRAAAVQPDGDPAPKALFQPLLAQVLVDIARIERAVAVAHGCRAGGADRVRIESSVRALNASLSLIAPVDDGGLTGPALLAYAAARHLPAADNYSFASDLNLWGRTVGPAADGGPLPPALFSLTRSAGATPDEAATVAVTFEAGVPTAINGVHMSFVDVVQNLGTIAGAHGVGRVTTAAGAVEAPAAVVLHAAHRALQDRVWDPETREVATGVSRHYAEIIERGGWFRPLRASLDAFVGHSQRAVTGQVRMTLYKATCAAVDEPTAA